jgi:hypothetical protein
MISFSLKWGRMRFDVLFAGRRISESYPTILEKDRGAPLWAPRLSGHRGPLVHLPITPTLSLKGQGSKRIASSADGEE